MFYFKVRNPLFIITPLYEMKPILSIDTGPMFSGKTTSLTGELVRQQLAKRQCLFIKHGSDNARLRVAVPHDNHSTNSSSNDSIKISVKKYMNLCEPCLAFAMERSQAPSNEFSILKVALSEHLASVTPSETCALCFPMHRSNVPLTLDTMQVGSVVMALLSIPTKNLPPDEALNSRESSQLTKPIFAAPYQHTLKIPTALCVDRLRDVPEEYLEGVEHIFIDEGQWFDDLVPQVLHWLMERRMNVHVAGLNADSQQRPFANMAQLFVFATHVTHHQAICHSCGQIASLSIRHDSQPSFSTSSSTTKDDESIHVVGHEDIYQAQCVSCHHKEISSAEDRSRQPLQPAFIVIDSELGARPAILSLL